MAEPFSLTTAMFAPNLFRTLGLGGRNVNFRPFDDVIANPTPRVQRQIDLGKQLNENLNLSDRDAYLAVQQILDVLNFTGQGVDVEDPDILEKLSGFRAVLQEAFPNALIAGTPDSTGSPRGGGAPGTPLPQPGTPVPNQPAPDAPTQGAPEGPGALERIGELLGDVLRNRPGFRIPGTDISVPLPPISLPPSGGGGNTPVPPDTTGDGNPPTDQERPGVQIPIPDFGGNPQNPTTPGSGSPAPVPQLGALINNMRTQTPYVLGGQGTDWQAIINGLMAQNAASRIGGNLRGF